MQSALDMLMSMCDTKLRFIIIITTVRVGPQKVVVHIVESCGVRT